MIERSKCAVILFHLYKSRLPSKPRKVSLNKLFKPHQHTQNIIPSSNFPSPFNTVKESFPVRPSSNQNSRLTLTSMAVVELRVGMHCERCIKAIKKAIKKIDDIETYKLDTTLNKITVTGNVTDEEVFRVLHKIGKNPTYWSEE